MATNIVVPALGESVTEATVAKWTKAVGDPVQRDETLAELETDKVTLEVYASTSGRLSEIRAPAGATVEVGAVLGVIESADGAAIAPAPAAAPAAPVEPAAAPSAPAAAAPAEAPAAPVPAAPAAATSSAPEALAPSVRKIVAESGIDISGAQGSGKEGRLTKADAAALAEIARETRKAATAPAPSAQAPAAPRALHEREERVRMTRLRKRIAERLKQAQETAAMLTTFNEVDMSRILQLRNAYKESFEKRHGVKLGFMSFFVKAAITALKEIPAVNAELDGDDIIYKNHYDIGVAVGTEQGLVVPVVRDADRMSFAEVEKKIAELGKRARDGKLAIEDLTGGTFTISNGGVYGSLMSTPILNPPQSGILGMHKTMPRPVAVGDRVEIRPMMYLALSYDHRVIDGREAVTFLVRLKECIEDPERILLDA